MKETKKNIYNLILLDESGSMTPDRDRVISNFNELIDDIKHQAKNNKEIKQYLSLITFNGIGIKHIHDCQKAKETAHITHKDYRPRSLTPLYDAMGYSIQNLKKKIKDNSMVITTIFTDGMENSSKEYDSPTLKKIINELENENWSFSYIGADHDVIEQANRLNINKTMRFSKTKSGFKQSLDVQKNYSAKINAMIGDDIEITRELKSNIWRETLEDSSKDSKS